MAPDAAYMPPPNARRVSEILLWLARDFPAERISIGDIIAALQERGFGLLMLVLALPSATPITAVPGVSTVFGLPLMAIAAQLMLGLHRPYFPKFILEKSVSRADLAKVAEKIVPYLERIEKILRPRWLAMTSFAAERTIGLVCLILATIMSLPIVFGNQPPAFAIALFAIGILERDGLFVVLGGVSAVVAVAVVSAFVFALFKAALFALGHLFA